MGFESQPNNCFCFGPSSSMGHIDKSSPGEFLLSFGKDLLVVE